MRHLQCSRVIAIALFRSSTFLRHLRSMPAAFQRHLVIAAVASTSFLMSRTTCQGTGMGQDLVETRYSQMRPDPAIPTPNEYKPSALDESSPVDSDLTSAMPHEVQQIEQSEACITRENVTFDELGYADQYSQMATSDLLIPISAAPVTLQAQKFVHERKTVRTSERTAEIWIKLPENSNAYVSVNFTERASQGSFQIFRTRLTKYEPRRYYIAAWCLCDGSGERILLEPTLNDPRICTDESGMYYVDLFPGDRIQIWFPNAPSCVKDMVSPDISARNTTTPQIDEFDSTSEATDNFSVGNQSDRSSTHANPSGIGEPEKESEPVAPKR